MASSRSQRDSNARAKRASFNLLRGKTARPRQLFMEFLEQRLLLAQDVWTGAGDGKSWQDGSNWSLSAAPGSNDSALINVGSSLTILYNGNSSFLSITDNAAIDITGGSFEVTSGTSQISGALTVAAGATLEASGSGVTFTATGATTIDGANLYAASGASLALPGATSYTGSNSATIQANGTGSLVDLSHLTTLSGATGYSALNINAQAGGEVNLSNVTSQPTGDIYAHADGASSVIDFSKLPELLSDAENNSGFEASNGGKILAGDLTSLNRGDIHLDDNLSSITTSQITSITSSNLFAFGGGDLVFPALTQISEPNGATIQASGVGSVLDLTSLTSLTGATGYSTLYIDAQAGGEVNLSNVTSQSTGRIYAHADGTSSVINFSKLPELYSDAESDSGFEASNGGKILAGDLTTLNRGDIQLDDGMSSITTSQITSITSSNLSAYGGGDLAFPALTQISEPNGATLLANGVGSVLDLTSLTSLTGATGYSTLYIDAQAGGEVNLSNVTSQSTGRIYAHADGTSSVIDFSKLPELYSDAESDSGFEASNGGKILAGDLTTLNRGDIQLDDGMSSITTSQITSITSSNLSVYGGGDLAFPALTQISEPNGATLLANGVGSVLDLTSLTSLTGATGYSTLYIDAQAGGEVNLSNVTSQSTGRIYAHADGTSSVINFSKLPELYSDAESDSGFEASNGGKILAGDLTTLNRGDIQLDDGMSSITTSQITSITSSNLSVYGGGDLAFPALTQISEPNGATLLANGVGSVLDLTSLTSLTGATGYSTLYIDAQAGGEVNLSNVTSQSTGRIYAHADGTSSVINFSKLPELYSDAESDSGFEASNGGKILAGDLTTLNRGDIQLDDGMSSITTSQITSITSSNLSVYGGGDLAFPALAQFSEPNGETILANGAGSVLDLTSLMSIDGATGYSTLYFNAQAGGEVNLSNVTSQSTGRIYAHADGTSSVIDFSKLPELYSDAESDSGFEASNGGKILAGDLTTLNRGDIQLDDGMSSITTSQITSITSSNLYAYGGGDLAFPALAQFSEPSGATLLANGAGTILDLTSLTSLDGATGYASLYIDAQAGGEVNLSKLASDPSGCTSFSADAASSVIDLADLTSLASNAEYNSTLSATNSGQIELTTGTINLTNVNLSANSSGTVTGGTVHLLPGSNLSGDSTIQADVENAGVITPGDNGIGVLTIDGSLSQYADGTLNVQLAGTTAGTQYDQLAVTGAV